MTSHLTPPAGFVGTQHQTQICERCAHWHRFDGDETVDGYCHPWGWCSRPLETAHVAAPFPPDRDGHDRLHTHATFGCNRWEPDE